MSGRSGCPPLPTWHLPYVVISVSKEAKWGSIGTRDLRRSLCHDKATTERGRVGDGYMQASTQKRESRQWQPGTELPLGSRRTWYSLVLFRTVRFCPRPYMRGIGGGTRTIIGIILHGGEVCQWGRTKERGVYYNSLQLRASGSGGWQGMPKCEVASVVWWGAGRERNRMAIRQHWPMRAGSPKPRIGCATTKMAGRRRSRCCGATQM